MASGTGYSSLLYEIYLCPFFCFLTTLLGLVSGSLPVSLGFGSTRQSLSFARLSPLSRNTYATYSFDHSCRADHSCRLDQEEKLLL